MLNREKFAYCRIPAWHEAGYTGQGIKVAVFEDTSQGHGRMVADVLQQIVPDAIILNRQRPGPIESSGNRLKPDTRARLTEFYQGLAAEGVHLCTMSLGGTGTSESAQLEQELLIDKGIVLFTSAGNEGREIPPRTAAAMPTWIAVGACSLTKNGPQRTSYSNYGPELACMGFTNLSTSWGGVFPGTSCANPFVAGLIGLYAGWCLKHYGRTPNQGDVLHFIERYAENPGGPGYSDMYGAGLLRLPYLASLKLPEPAPEPDPTPQPPKEDDKMFTDIHSHWAKADIEQAAKEGLLTGYPDGRFDPDGPVTRGQLAAVLNRVLAKVGK
jgi:hypothetical protein